MLPGSRPSELLSSESESEKPSFRLGSLHNESGGREKGIRGPGSEAWEEAGRSPRAGEEAPVHQEGIKSDF